MSRLEIHTTTGQLPAIHADWECIEFHGDVTVSTIFVSAQGDTTLYLYNDSNIFIGQDGWNIWICDEEAKLSPEWERLYPAKPVVYREQPERMILTTDEGGSDER